MQSYRDRFWRDNAISRLLLHHDEQLAFARALIPADEYNRRLRCAELGDLSVASEELRHSTMFSQDACPDGGMP